MSISVVMPNYNNARFLRQCLESFADDPAVTEIVIYDNASTDGSRELIRAFPSTKIRLIEGDTNLFATGGRDAAIKASTQPYLSFVDGDDFVSPSMHSICLQRLLEDDLDAAVPETVRVDADGNNPVPFVPAPDQIIDGETGLWMTINGWRISLSGVLRREIYEAAWQGFQPYGYRDDEHLTRRMILTCNRIGGAPAQLFYRTSPRPPPSMRPQAHAIHTQMRAVALAASRRRADWEETLRLTRNETVWATLRLLRLYPGRETRTMLPRLMEDLRQIKLPWKPHDWPHLFASRLLRLLARRY